MSKKAEAATLTAEEGCALLGISRGAFYQAVKRKQIPHLRVGKRILIPRVAFVRWLECGVQSQSK